MSSEHSEIEQSDTVADHGGWHKRHDIGFLVLISGCVLLLLALITYDPDDIAWSVVGEGQAGNSAGQVGAYIADFLLHGLGYLAFAFPALIMGKAWQLFRKAPALESRIWFQRVGGLILLLCTLSGLASLSIWSGEQLPAGAGGILGQGLTELLVPLFGFYGAVLIYVSVLAAALVLFIEFSWLQFFERLGGWALTRWSRWTGSRITTEDVGGAVKTQPQSERLPFTERLLKRTQEKIAGSRDSDTTSKASAGAADQILNEPVSDPLESAYSMASAEVDHAAHQYDDADPLMDYAGFSATDDEVNDFAGLQGFDQHESVKADPVSMDNTPEPPPFGVDPVPGLSSEQRPEQNPAHTLENDRVQVPDSSRADRSTEQASEFTSESSSDLAPELVPDEADAPSLKIEPLEKRESRTSDRAKRDLQGTLFKHSDPLPSIALLDPPRTDVQSGFSEERLRDLSGLLVQKLADFGVKIEVSAVAPGPVITRFEIQPAPGVKASKISNLAKDLARSMAMVAVRVVEVIPGKSVMGIEVPNENRAVVTLGEVLSSEDYDKSKSPLTLALGHDIAGNPVITDLAKMPHLLVAGTTGSGKSVGVNAMLLSLLFKSTPEELRLILVDPKMLELSVYEGIPHLLTPVITDMKEAASGLRWSVAEMERRYQLMAAMGVRNIAGYNKKVKEAIDAGTPIADPLWQIDQSFDTTPPTLEPLPYIVIVIDEFADMMMMVGKKVEELIARIAQKARAAGIHMILATQRPSVDVITGLIKANVPTRIAFQVSSKIDSRTILDQGGAEQLLGHGDMLYMPPGNAVPERVHGAFVDDDEVHRLVAEWKQRGEPNYLEEITQIGEDGAVPGMAGGDDNGEQDDLYDQAVAFVTESGKCSISSVQRKLRIGYNRAARLVETMEAAGVVSPPAHNGAREVIAPPPV